MAHTIARATIGKLILLPGTDPVVIPGPVVDTWLDGRRFNVSVVLMTTSRRRAAGRVRSVPMGVGAHVTRAPAFFEGSPTTPEGARGMESYT